MDDLHSSQFVDVYIAVQLDETIPFRDTGELHNGWRSCQIFRWLCDSNKKTDLTTRELVLGELFPIVAEQFGVELKKLTPQTRFVEDLGAG